MGTLEQLFRSFPPGMCHTRSIQSVAWVLFILSVDLQCYLCLHGGSHHGAASARQIGFSRGVDGKHYRHLEVWQRGGGLALDSDDGGAAAARPGRIAAVSSRELGVQLHANSSGKSAPESEAEALVAFKAITDDPLDALRSWTASANGSNVCSGWAGVTCSPQYPNHVVSLRLPDLQLSGTINSLLLKLSNLPYLQELDLSLNNLSGTIEGASLANFSQISYFNLSCTFITGGVPSEIEGLVSLQYLDISATNLTGLIPASLGNCSLLRNLGLAQNNLIGTIPPSLGRLSNLYRLNLQNNQLWGSIPSELGNCSSLSVLSVVGNFRLGPHIPQELSRPPLKVLYISRCSFTGTFPLWILTNHTDLLGLGLSYNQFEGGIPDAISQFGLVQALALGGNPWGGGVPSSISNCTSLALLTLESSELSGTIPWQLGLLSSLEILYLTENSFTGLIPSSLSNLSLLTSLELGYNSQLDPQSIPSWLASLTNLEQIYFTAMNWHGNIPELVIGNLSNLQLLTMDTNSLTGTIPTSFRNCTYLDTLGLSGNVLTGEVPSELGGLSYMFFLSVAYNRLIGSFPEFISNWTMLSTLDAEYNSLSGSLEGISVGQLGHIRLFTVQGNSFVGPIPEAFANFSIDSLSLSDNHLSGTIPSSLGDMTGLQELHLGGNQLEGEIPVHLLNSGQLVLLDLSSNKLEGSLPAEVGQLSQLTELYLENNNFSGTLPSSLGNCTKMSILDLSYNQFQGTIPGAAISQMSASLISLNFSNNLFSGPWPREFSKLAAVQIINVSSNNLSGSIPLGLGNCVNLHELDVSVNNFTGAIPQDLGSLQQLQFFNASFNSFEGSIPQSGLFNSNRIDQTSFLGNPGLCGSTAIIGLQHQECAVLPGNVSSGHQACKGFNCKRVWVPAVVTVSSLTVLGAVAVAVGIGCGWIACRKRTTANNYAKTGLQNWASHMRISERDVLKTVGDPSGANVIGGGARSIVYRGVLPGGEMFALKKLLPDSNDGHDHSSIEAPVDYGNGNKTREQLVKEAEILANLRHKNILKVLSFYSSFDLNALILEYMSEGSLHKHLHEMETPDLTWKTRLKIAFGVAQGMAYLHHDLPEPVIHRDLKPGNILLDADLEPKVGDFGISKFVNPQKDGEATASTFCGTIGYMPPEYASVPWVSTKGDVYSYGMVLLELMTGRQPALSEDGVHDHGQDLRTRVFECFHQGPFELLDPLLAKECELDENTKEQMVLLLRVSLFCTRATPKSRPSMMEVVGMVRYIMDLGVEPVKRRTVEELANEMNSIYWACEDPGNEGTEFAFSG